MILDIRTISRSGKDDLPKEDEKDAFELLPLTQDSLEMLQIRNVKADRREGEKEGEIELRERFVEGHGGDIGRNDEHKGVNVTKGNQILSKTTSCFSLTISVL